MWEKNASEIRHKRRKPTRWGTKRGVVWEECWFLLGKVCESWGFSLVSFPAIPKKSVEEGSCVVGRGVGGHGSSTLCTTLMQKRRKRDFEREGKWWKVQKEVEMEEAREETRGIQKKLSAESFSGDLWRSRHAKMESTGGGTSKNNESEWGEYGERHVREMDMERGANHERKAQNWREDACESVQLTKIWWRKGWNEGEVQKLLSRGCEVGCGHYYEGEVWSEWSGNLKSTKWSCEEEKEWRG